MFVALERQHDVDEMFQRPRAGEVAVLGDMADSTTAIPRLLASDTKAVVTARIWVTPPVTPSTPPATTVCTESTISRWDGRRRRGRGWSRDRSRTPGRCSRGRRRCVRPVTGPARPTPRR